MFTLDNRHSLALPYWARPGLRSVINADAAGGNGDEGDEGDEDDEDDEGDDDDDADAGKSVEELRAELKTVRQNLSKASGSSKDKRDKIKSLKAELAGKGAPAAATAADGTPDIEAIKAAARAEAKAEGDRVRIGDKSELALARADVDPAKLARAVRLLDLDDLELGADGSIDGLDEQIAELKTEWPELFTSKRKRRSVAGDDDRDGNRRNTAPKSATERQAAMLLGKG